MRTIPTEQDVLEHGVHGAYRRLDNPSDPHAITSAEWARRFIFAGNARFTIRSTKTGTRYTFRVSIPKDCRRCGQSPCTCNSYFVSFLTGSDNESDYSYLGMIDSGVFRLTRASKMRQDSPPVLAILWTLKHLNAGQMPKDCEVWHEGRCGRCGRTLTVPESIENGIGPECIKRVGL